MTSSKNTKLLTELLNLEGVRVTSHEKYAGIGRLLQIELTKKVKKCPRCVVVKQVEESIKTTAM